MSIAEKIGVHVPEVLLPVKEIDPHKWAVIACDHFTSQPEYWDKVAQTVGDAPSTFHLILPEAWLHAPDVKERIRKSQQAMQDYLDDGILEPHKGFVFVERQIADKVQSGLVVALDLECYDYNKGSQTLIRATEGPSSTAFLPAWKSAETLCSNPLTFLCSTTIHKVLWFLKFSRESRNSPSPTTLI